MIRVLLLHGGSIAHYRVPIYGYLSSYLRRYGFDLMVTSAGIETDNPDGIGFQYIKIPLTFPRIAKLIYTEQIDIIIVFAGLKHLFAFPTYLFAKGFLGRKIVYWGHGRDLADRGARIKNLAYATQHALCDSIILYADHLKKYVGRRFHKKIFIANNTLCLDYPGLPGGAKEQVLARYGINTRKNIICVGRLQRRKRLDHLVEALRYMNRSDVGLILVGPDPDGTLRNVKADNIYKLGPINGVEKFDLLSAADVYCLPGAVGLSIVDAFHCGLPIVTEDGDESPEIMYLRDGKNGFVVSRGDIPQLAQKLLVLLDDDELRRQFSDEARREIAERGHIDRLCSGFRDALRYAIASEESSSINSVSSGS